jgi:hypothetical protein
MKIYPKRDPQLFLTRAVMEEIVKFPQDLRDAFRKIGEVS